MGDFCSFYFTNVFKFSAINWISAFNNQLLVIQKMNIWGAFSSLKTLLLSHYLDNKRNLLDWMLRDSRKWLQPDFLAWISPAARNMLYALAMLDFIILFIDLTNNF